jgi:hypothetical protein
MYVPRSSGLVRTTHLVRQARCAIAHDMMPRGHSSILSRSQLFHVYSPDSRKLNSQGETCQDQRPRRSRLRRRPLPQETSPSRSFVRARSMSASGRTTVSTAPFARLHLKSDSGKTTNGAQLPAMVRPTSHTLNSPQKRHVHTSRPGTGMSAEVRYGRRVDVRKIQST